EYTSPRVLGEVAAFPAQIEAIANLKGRSFTAETAAALVWPAGLHAVDLEDANVGEVAAQLRLPETLHTLRLGPAGTGQAAGTAPGLAETPGTDGPALHHDLGTPEAMAALSDRWPEGLAVLGMHHTELGGSVGNLRLPDGLISADLSCNDLAGANIAW